MAFLTVVAAVLRIIGLNEGLWIDEIQTLDQYVGLPAREIITSYQTRNNHVLYSLAAHYSVAWFGQSPWALRLPAVLAGLATIPAACYLGRQLASRSEAFLAGALLALSYHHVWFSQNARGYTGLLLGAVLLSICFIRLLASEKPGRGSIIAYALIAALSCWIHLAAALVVVAHSIIWLIVSSPLAGQQRIGFKWPPLIAMLLASVFSLALYFPLLTRLAGAFLPAKLLPSLPNTTGNAVAPVNQLAWETFDWLLSEFSAAILGAVPGGWPMLLVIGLAMGAGVLSYLRQGIVAAGILMLPTFVTFVIVNPMSAFFPRFLFGSAVFFLLIAVRGGFVFSLAVLPMLNTRNVTAIGLLVAVATGTRVPQAWHPKQDFAGAARFIAAHRLPEDAVVCGPQTHLLNSHFGMDCQRVGSADDLTALEQTHVRTWFLYTLPLSFQFHDPALWAKVQNDYDLVTTIRGTLRGGDILIMRRAENDVGMKGGG